MTEPDPLEIAINRWLRRSLAAPVPSLPPDFDQRLMRELSRSPRTFQRYRRILLTGYGLVSVVTSAVVLRSHGLHWGTIAVTMLGPLAMTSALLWRGVRQQRSGRTS